MIDYTNKLIFVHIPKTGGSSVESILCHEGFSNHNVRASQTVIDNNLQDNFPLGTHSPLSAQVHHISNKGIRADEFRRFAIVRNPWDRVTSYYKYHLQYGFIPSGMRFGHDYLKLKPFVLRSNILHMLDGSVDRILSFSNLSEEFNTLMDDLNVECPKLPIVNVSKDTTHYREFFKGDNEELINVVRSCHVVESKKFKF